jgi:hypothetical protein
VELVAVALVVAGLVSACGGSTRNGPGGIGDSGAALYVLRLARQSGNNVPSEAFANVKPLHGALVYLVRDGDALRISGFQTIK